MRSRSVTARGCSRTAPAAGTRRSASGSPSITAFRRARRADRRRPQGFAFYAAEQLARRPGRVLVEAPSYDRPLKILARERRRDRRARDGRGGPRPRRARSGAQRRCRPPVVPLHDPDVPEPERADAVARAPRAARRDRARARARGPRGRPVRARPLRGRGAASLLELEGGDARHVHVVVLEDRRARRANGVLRLPDADAPRVRGTSRLDVHLAAVSPAGDRARSSSQRGRFEPNLERVRGELRARRDAMLEALERYAARGCVLEPARRRLLRLARARRRRTRPISAARAEGEGVDDRAGRGFFPPARASGELRRLAFSYETPERIAEGVERLLGLS